MTDGGSSRIMRVFLGLAGAQVVAVMIYAAVRWRTGEAMGAGARVEPVWFPADHLTTRSADSASTLMVAGTVEVMRISPVTLSQHELTLNLLEIPGYSLSQRKPHAMIREVELELEGVNRRLQEVVRAAWVPPVVKLPSTHREGRLRLVIARNGRVERRYFTMPSGSDLLDASLVNTLAAIDCAPSLPAAYGGSEYEVEIRFVLPWGG